MSTEKPMKILISGGGTGGHIFPALAIAGALRRRHPDCEILFVGASNRMEMERVPAAGYKIVGLPVSGFNRKNILANFKVIYHLAKSMLIARKVLKTFKPDIAIGVGGYASGPMLKQAQKHGIPTLIQEQNSYAGVTNKLLAKKASAICTAYPGMDKFFPGEKITLTGNPVREAITANAVSPQEARRQLGLPEDKPVLLVVGGSLGARTINQSVEASLEKWKQEGIFTLWQTGKFYAEKCSEIAGKYSDSVIATPFIDRMDLAYRAADLVVSRAGAGTISELQLLSKPAVLVPSPNVAEDHQRRNAEALATRGAAVMVLDADAPSKLQDTVVSLITDPGRLCKTGEAAGKMALPKADEKIVDIIDNILAKK
ncbi:undecaprenyldiphospho-muramoylpentapeptide beta-N-acetylglucosaminyltransferase [uncultured Muribaculum sp.]|uniref:undecaprenyldiphospho-muramoylpentapeptide beta-N-acetylglucosaminyltransferase n=1 Tax=uncultured Muribaculum sp. TaxID=1918613 RepID=UPI0025AFEE5D|nr:undecaprenyldiphospho-muramoylpentapeptide beta-N-acetylglucosaminyltransferase [uncultured Muribaculum sp.]